MFRDPFPLTYTIRFDDGRVVTATETLAPGTRWALKVDDAYPGPVPPQNINAVIVFTAPKALPLQVALWHSPIARGVVPVVYAVQWTCR